MSKALIESVEKLLVQLENEHLSEFSEEPIEQVKLELEKLKNPKWYLATAGWYGGEVQLVLLTTQNRDEAVEILKTYGKPSVDGFDTAIIEFNNYDDMFKYRDSYFRDHL